MGEKILGWFEKIATGEKRRWFFASLIILLILGIIVFPYIDANFLYYNRIEKRIDNLTSLVSLTNTPLEKNEILYNEYLSILEEMKTARENSLFNAEKTEDSTNDRLLKFLGGSVLWLIVAVALLFHKKKGERLTIKHWMNNFVSALFCLIVGGILGCVFTYIPTIGSVKFNFVLSPVVQIIVLWLIMESPKSKATPEHKEV